MPDTTMIGTDVTILAREPGSGHAASGVAWPAILAGAVAATSTSLILLALGSGLGLAAVSPWASVGASAATFTVTAAIWLIVTQWVASGLGGYLTGRLRTDWAGLHTHEVTFRDTANGFLTWATASVIGAALLTAAASASIGGTARLAAARAEATAIDPTAWYVDRLYRSDHPATNAPDAEMRAQSTRILTAMDMSELDKNWLSGLVAARTGLSRAEAVTRVEDVFALKTAAGFKVREAADAARTAGSYLSIFTGLSMLIGAFIACVAAAIGGRERDMQRDAR